MIYEIMIRTLIFKKIQDRPIIDRIYDDGFDFNSMKMQTAKCSFFLSSSGVQFRGLIQDSPGNSHCDPKLIEL